MCNHIGNSGLVVTSPQTRPVGFTGRTSALQATVGKISPGMPTYLFYKFIPWALMLTGVAALVAGIIAASRSLGWRRGVAITSFTLLLLITAVPVFDLLNFYGVIETEPLPPPLPVSPPHSPVSPPSPPTTSP